MCLICLRMPGGGVSRWPGCGRGGGQGLSRTTVTARSRVRPVNGHPSLCVMYVADGSPVTRRDNYGLYPVNRRFWLRVSYAGVTKRTGGSAESALCAGCYPSRKVFTSGYGVVSSEE
jgi:hypothetical protein